MIRKLITGLLVAFAAVGCQDTEPTDSASTDDPAGAGERTSSEICGGFAGIHCDDGLYCDFPPETNCGSGDQTGVCTVPPTACTKEYDPVCGCDGKTYGNACVASSASVSVRSEGECK